MGQHSGIYTANITKWVGQHAGTRSKTQKKIGLGVGQHAGIVGQHEQEWWVNMDRNLQKYLPLSQEASDGQGKKEGNTPSEE